MKAWEIAKKIVDEAPAILVYETENDWTQNDLQSAENNTLRTMWHSKAPGSGAPASLIAGAVQSVYNMGRNVEEADYFLRAGYEALKVNDMVKLHRNTQELFTALNHAPKNEASDYWKYDVYEDFEQFSFMKQKMTGHKMIYNLQKIIRFVQCGIVKHQVQVLQHHL